MRFSAHGFFVSDRINRMDKMTSENVNGENSVDSVHSVEKPLPNSRKIYVSSEIHPGIRVPFREIKLAPTKSSNGAVEVNEPVRVYDTSGPWGDPDFHRDVTQGLPPLRTKWIRDRDDVEEYKGRKVQPIDDGWLSDAHAAHVSRKRPASNAQRSTSNSKRGNGASSNSAFGVRRSAFGISRKPLRASASHPVTQLWYA